jgi:uncharacterized repeat protein (TIGR03803 family)
VSKFNWWTRASALFLLWAATAIASPAQTFKTLYSFGRVGAYPHAGLVQATNGNLYGTTSEGGANGGGTVFKITPSGKLTTLHSFNSTDYPIARLVQATDGNFYGTTQGGGTSTACGFGCGTVFKITPSGTLTTLYSFCSQSGCTDGAEPYEGLIQATDGNFYGTTLFGGASTACAGGGCGTVFKITPSGTLTTLHSFDDTDGYYPQAALVQATNGNLYGTTPGGGAYQEGTVFKITSSGKLTTLHSFDGTDGAIPYAGLVQATNGNLYGTTSGGGGYQEGTVFKITSSGKLTTLHSFHGPPGGAIPNAGLVQATDGNFYGTTINGGTSTACGGGCGTVFKITPSGKLTTVWNFCSRNNCADGGSAYAGLVQDTNGTFYGTTEQRGVNGYGTVFSLSVGLGPFVSFVGPQSSGKVGNTIELLGQGFTGTTAVSFNGTAASFSVKSNTYLTATVPNGATTGKVKVVTPSRTLLSNVPFRVTPQILSFGPTSGKVRTPVTIKRVSLIQTTKVTFGGVKPTSVTVNSDKK